MKKIPSPSLTLDLVLVCLSHFLVGFLISFYSMEIPAKKEKPKPLFVQTVYLKKKNPPTKKIPLPQPIPLVQEPVSHPPSLESISEPLEVKKEPEKTVPKIQKNQEEKPKEEVKKVVEQKAQQIKKDPDLKKKQEAEKKALELKKRKDEEKKASELKKKLEVDKKIVEKKAADLKKKKEEEKKVADLKKKTEADKKLAEKKAADLKKKKEEEKKAADLKKKEEADKKLAEKKAADLKKKIDEEKKVAEAKKKEEAERKAFELKKQREAQEQAEQRRLEEARLQQEREEEARRQAILDSMKNLQSQIKGSQSGEDLPKLNLKDLQVPTLSIKVDVSGGDLPQGYVETSYATFIVSTLQRKLTLPEHGQIRLEITLTRDGKISGWKILECGSDENRDYIKKHLPGITFPPMEDAYPGQKQVSFPLRFQS